MNAPCHRKILLPAALTATFLAVMSLPVPAAEGDDASPLVTVQAGRIIRATLHETVVTYGRVTPSPAVGGQPPASSAVAAPVVGIVVQTLCEEGQKVEKDAVLLRLDTRVADVEVVRARVELDYAERDLAREQRLIEIDGTSLKQLQDAEQRAAAARQALADVETRRSLLEVRAPLAGTLVKLAARPGEAVETNTVVAEIVDLDRLIVEARVPSSRAGAIAPGQEVLIGAGPGVDPRGEHPEAAVRARVVTISPVVTPDSDSVVVRAALPAGAGLRPGRFVTARIVTGACVGCLAVPEESLAQDDGGRDVVAIIEHGRAIHRPVVAGLRDRGLVAVEGEGLAAGMVVVTLGAWALPDGAAVEVSSP